MAKRGPKVIELNWEDFDKLCEMQCTLREIAAWFHCSEDTIERRVQDDHGMKFAEYYAQKKAKGFVSLRRAQWQAATIEQIPSMLIWLGKQHLDQKDQQHITAEQEIKVVIDKDDDKL